MLTKFKYKYLKVNGDVNTTGNRRAPAEGKEAGLCLNSESKCLLFCLMGIFHKTLNLVLELLLGLCIKNHLHKFLKFGDF